MAECFREALVSYVYAKAADLVGTPALGTRQCVALVKYYTKAPAASLWKEGAEVRGNLNLAVGTGIATFVNGKYPNLPHGNHAAFYIGQDATGIIVVDQWKSVKRPNIGRRTLLFRGKLKNGEYLEPEDNGDAFSVIE